MKPFVKIPFLRISIPYISGILFQLAFNPAPPAWHWLILSGLMVAIPVCFNRNEMRTKYIALVGADVFLFVIAMQLTWQANLSNREDYYANKISVDSTFTALVIINELPEEKEKFTRCGLSIKAVKTSVGMEGCCGSVLAYFKKDAHSRALRAGQNLIIKLRLSEVPQSVNPFQFDYRQYLSNRQIFHTAFIDSGAYCITEQPYRLNSIILESLKVKEWMVQTLRNSGLDSTAFSICSALLTGYDAEVDKSVMEAFSHSGTLHVLSVSGLHTGLIYLALNYLFGLIDRHKRYRLLRFLFVGTVLWMFAFVTGLSAPVLRAVIMFNLFGLGKIYFRNDYRNQLNILLVSAFILLLYNPYFITEVGFVLSYTALAGIILYQPWFSQIWEPGNWLSRWCWQSICASVAATIGTLPVTLFYFKQFPLWFFIANLLVVPLTFVLLLMAMLIIAKIGLIAPLVNCLVQFLLFFMGLFNTQGKGYIDGIDFSLFDALVLLVLINFITLLIQTRRYKWAVYTLFVLITWQCTDVLLSFSSKSSKLFTVYATRKSSVVSLKNKTRVRINRIDTVSYNYNVKPHLTSFNHPDMEVGEFNYFENAAGSVLILNKPGYWPEIAPGKINVLLLANNFKLNEKDLAQLTGLKLIVADASNNTFTRHKTGELSRKFGLDFYDVKSRGAFLMPLK